MSLPLAKQVISQPLAKRLKALNVRQDSIFAWHLDGTLFQPMDMENPYIDYSAFTSSEIGEMLPGVYHPFKMDDGRYIWLREKENDPRSYADTETEARGLMLAYLIKTKIINVKDL